MTRTAYHSKLREGDGAMYSKICPERRQPGCKDRFGPPLKSFHQSIDIELCGNCLSFLRAEAAKTYKDKVTRNCFKPVRSLR